MAQIEPFQSDDAEDVHALLVAAFERNIEAELVETLRVNCERRVELVARAAERPVGYVLLTPGTINETAVTDTGTAEPGSELTGLALGPIAVISDHRQRGIGAALMNHAWRAAGELGARFVMLIGDPDYYTRFGFIPAARFGIACEFADVPADTFLLRWNGASRNYQAGRARYRREFDVEI